MLKQLVQFVNITEAISRLAIADGIETKGLIRTEEDLQAEQQAQQQAMMDEQQQSALLNAGQTIAGKIPPNHWSSLNQ